MKLAGHTHGVQDICSDVFEMVDRVAALGFEGLEMAARSGVVLVDSTKRERNRLRGHIARAGLELVNIACYAGEGTDGLNAVDKSVRRRAEAGIRDHLLLAEALGSPCVRVFPGGKPGDEGVVADPQRALELSVSGIQRLATVAMDLGIILLIENHPNSIAGSAEETVTIIEAVGHPNVRILYEPSNLLVYAGRDDHRRGFDVQKSWIRHVHIKDQVQKPNGDYEVTVAGHGILPWGDIVGWLKDAVYQHFLSFELAWTKDLDRREQELREGIEFIRRSIGGGG